MEIDPNTQIGADGNRHPIDEIDEWQDPEPYRRRSIAVRGARADGQVPVPDDDNPGDYIWGDTSDGGSGLPDGSVVPYVFTPTSTTYPSVVDDLDPWAYYRGDQTAGVLQDASGNDRHAVSSTASPAFGGEPFTNKLGPATLLDAGARITLPSFDTSGAFSLAGWFALDGDAGLGAAGAGLFVSKTNSGGGGSFGFTLALDPTLGLLVLNANNAAVGGTPYVEDGHHFVALTSGASIGGGHALTSVYVDGVARGRNYRSLQNGGDLAVGRAVDGYWNARTVTFSDLALWEGVELTPAQVEQLYAAGLEGPED